MANEANRVIGSIWLAAAFLLGALSTTPLQTILAGAALILGAIITVAEALKST